MGIYIDGVFESIKKSLNANLWLYFLLVAVISLVVSGLFLAIFAFGGAALVSGVLGTDLLKLFLDAVSQNPEVISGGMQLMQALANPVVLANLAIAIVALIIVFAVIATLIESFFQAVLYSLSRGFLLDSRLDLGRAFSEARQRFLTLFQTKIIIGIFVLIIALIIFLPVLLSIPGLLQQLPALALSSSAASPALASLLGFLLLSLLLFGVFSVIMFFLSPYLILAGTVAVLEEEGAIGTIKRTISILQGKYWGSLGFILLFAILLMLITTAYMVIYFLLGLFSIIPLLAILAVILQFIIQIIFTIWASSCSSLAYVALYKINSGSGSRKRHSSKAMIGVMQR